VISNQGHIAEEDAEETCDGMFISAFILNVTAIVSPSCLFCTLSHLLASPCLTLPSLVLPQDNEFIPLLFFPLISEQPHNLKQTNMEY
jgi:hypothetical protein